MLLATNMVDKPQQAECLLPISPLHLPTIGRDATRMLVSEDMKDSGLEAYALDGLTSAQLYELGDWLKLYTRKYPCVGYIPSAYRSPMGDASDLLTELLRAWNKQSPESLDFFELLPPCNSFFDGKILRLTCNLYSR